MNIGIIHDNKHLDRLGFISQLARQGINYYKIFPAMYHHSPHTGIMQAHKNAVKTLFETPTENGLPDRVCVMEDDVKFTTPHSFQKFIDQTPPDFDIYLAGYYLAHGITALPNGIAKVNDFAGMHCYIIHRKALDRFLKLQQGKHVDRACKGMDIYTCYPVVAMQEEGFSYRNNRVQDHSTLIARIPHYKG